MAIHTVCLVLGTFPTAGAVWHIRTAFRTGKEREKETVRVCSAGVFNCAIVAWHARMNPDTQKAGGIECSPAWHRFWCQLSQTCWRSSCGGMGVCRARIAWAWLSLTLKHKYLCVLFIALALASPVSLYIIGFRHKTHIYLMFLGQKSACLLLRMCKCLERSHSPHHSNVMQYFAPELSRNLG